VEIDPEATEKLQVMMSDFRHALVNDVKPVSSTNCIIIFYWFCKVPLQHFLSLSITEICSFLI